MLFINYDSQLLTYLSFGLRLKDKFVHELSLRLDSLRYANKSTSLINTGNFKD